MIPIRERVRVESTWDRPEAHSRALGCERCPDLPICGGLHTRDGAFDCHDRCDCKDPTKCRSVCRLSPVTFAKRFREVGGFDFTNVARAPLVSVPLLPLVVPMIYHGSSRVGELIEPYVSVPLHHLYSKRDGKPRFRSKEELCNSFGVRPDACVVASGVGQDNQIEPFWRLCSAEFLVDLQQMGIALFTTPNFSLSSDAPRPDNLHAMKRIALTWSAMSNAGLPTALHLNARTDRDYARWTDWLCRRPEVTAIAFEFGTGAGKEGRVQDHVQRLCAIAAQVGRPLTVIVRGGVRHLATLRMYFASVVVLDTTPFTKTYQRQRGVVRQGEKLIWEKADGRFKRGTPIDELLAHNIEMSRRSIVDPPMFHMQSRGTGRRKNTQHIDHEARQGSFGAGFEHPSVKGPFAA